MADGFSEMAIRLSAAQRQSLLAVLCALGVTGLGAIVFLGGSKTDTSGETTEPPATIAGSNIGLAGDAGDGVQSDGVADGGLSGGAIAVSQEVDPLGVGLVDSDTTSTVETVPSVSKTTAVTVSKTTAVTVSKTTAVTVPKTTTTALETTTTTAPETTTTTAPETTATTAPTTGDASTTIATETTTEAPGPGPGQLRLPDQVGS